MATNLMERKYIIHVKTKNISFLQTAKDLKTLGIRNSYFFLKLYDQSLLNVDPHSPILTDDLKIRIINECMINPWYFLREVARIPDSGGNGIPFLLSRGNAATIWCFLQGHQFYNVMPRQTGKTQSNLAIVNWAFLFGSTSSEFMFIGKDQELANLNLARLKAQRDLLPKYMHFKVAYDEEGRKQEETNNVKSLSNIYNKNTIVTKPKATSKEKAESIGRGATQPIQVFDEFEFTSHIKTIVQASGPAYKSASKAAKRNNAVYGRIFLSTPGDLDSDPAKDAMEVIEQSCKWTEQMYDMSASEADDYKVNNSRNEIIYIEYNYKQLGLDEQWVKETSQSLLFDPIMIKREIHLKRIRGSSESPFDRDKVEYIIEQVADIKEEIIFNKFFKLDVYKPLDPNRIYIVGVDCSEGVGGDNSAITVIDPYIEEPVAEFKSPYIGIEDYKRFLFVLIKKYIPKAILAIERNHVGGAIIQGLKEKGLNNNLYFDSNKEVGDKIDDKLDDKGFLKMNALIRKLYGVFTGETNRKIMMGILFNRVDTAQGKFITENISNDIANLVKTKTGRIEARGGFHDDSVMSYLIAMFVLYYGNNLERYGFIKGFIPDEENRNQGIAITEEEMTELLPEFDPNLYKFDAEYNRDLELAKETYNAKHNVDVTDKLAYNSSNFRSLDDEDANEGIPMDFFDELNS